MTLRLNLITVIALFWLITVNPVQAQTFDISSGGQATITGALGGSVAASSNTSDNLLITINFGEVSPVNPNQIVKVTIPIFIRSIQPYQVNASAAGTINGNPNAVQASDAGFGIRAVRASGGKSQICTNSSHLIRSPFGSDPQSTAALDSSGRIKYQASLEDITASPIILSGPKLTQGSGRLKRSDDGYIFDAVFVITPQFYQPGTTSAIITFTISAGSNVPC